MKTGLLQAQMRLFYTLYLDANITCSDKIK